MTYLPLEDGSMFLAAVIDRHSRFVLSWRLSNTLDGRFAFYNHERLHQRLAYRTPAEVYHNAKPVSPRRKETPRTIT